ncbi:hypothetical protein ACGF3C_27605 [Micromonospora sp. NPDC047762]
MDRRHDQHGRVGGRRVALPLTALTVLDASAYQPALSFSGPAPPLRP